MVTRKSISAFASEVSKTPMSNRRNGLSNRKAAVGTLALTAGFFLGLASGVALWLLDKKTGASRPA